jgi:hypothetical protein
MLLEAMLDEGGTLRVLTATPDVDEAPLSASGPLLLSSNMDREQVLERKKARLRVLRARESELGREGKSERLREINRSQIAEVEREMRELAP